MSEVAQVERTASFQATAPSTRAATPQPPAADQVAQFPVIILARGGDIASPGVDPESPTAASTDSNSSSVKAKGERNGKQGEREVLFQLPHKRTPFRWRLLCPRNMRRIQQPQMCQLHRALVAKARLTV